MIKVVEFSEELEAYSKRLCQVRGINHIRLGAIRSRLTVNTDEIVTRNGFPPSFIHSTPKSSPKLSTSHSSQPIVNGKISGTT